MSRMLKWSSIFCRKALLSLAVFAYWMLPTVVQAQSAETAIQIQQFRPWADPEGMFQTQSGTTSGQWKYNVGLYFNYGKEPLILREENGDKRPNGQIVGHQIGADVIGSIGLLKWLDFGISIPMTIYQIGEVTTDSAPYFNADITKDQSGFAFGDIKFGFKAQALRQKKHWLNLAFQVYMGVPTGDETRFNGEDSLMFGGSALLNRRFGRLNLGLNLGYRYLPRTEVLNLIINHEIHYSLGASFALMPKKLDLIGDLSGSAALSAKTSVESAPFDIYLGARYYPLQTTDLALSLGLGLPFLPGYGSPQVRVLLGVMWAPRDHDKDGDTVLDHKDRCPKIKGPVANMGCPWPDTDGDGLTDNIDRCPKKAGPKRYKGCPDLDGDDIPDVDDKCPDKAGPVSRKGCPWGDADKDGLKDNVDKCPKKAGPKANKGCPWPDTDKDTVTDNIDNCPKRKGPKENKGCPDTDRDGDGVVDRLDKCPNVPGIKEKQGCPKKVLVKLTKEKIEILQKVYFRTGRSRIRRRSYEVLNQVISVMKSNPKLKLRIEGHTDNRGSKRRNRRLSKYRARAVFRYFKKKGVDKGRMVYKGFGQARPIDTNKTRKGRSKNRRVEFRITAQ